MTRRNSEYISHIALAIAGSLIGGGFAMLFMPAAPLIITGIMIIGIGLSIIALQFDYLRDLIARGAYFARYGHKRVKACLREYVWVVE